MTSIFRVTTENELGITRLAECEHDDATWNIKSDKRGLVISRDDDHTSISLRVPLDLMAAFMWEMMEQERCQRSADACHRIHAQRKKDGTA